MRMLAKQQPRLFYTRARGCALRHRARELTPKRAERAVQIAQVHESWAAVGFIAFCVQHR